MNPMNKGWGENSLTLKRNKVSMLDMERELFNTKKEQSIYAPGYFLSSLLLKRLSEVCVCMFVGGGGVTNPNPAWAT